MKFFIKLPIVKYLEEKSNKEGYTTESPCERGWRMPLKGGESRGWKHMSYLV